MAQKYGDSFYDNQASGSVKSAEKTLGILKGFVGSPKSVVDFGCGAGGWLAAAKETLGAETILGLESHPNAYQEGIIGKDNVRFQDLSEPVILDQKFDLAMSLEVAEHLLEEKASTFVKSLTAASNKVFFSAALPSQGGVGHVNERWPSYWIEKFNAEGYELFDVVRPLIWDDQEIAYWYRQNAMLFSNEPLDVIYDAADWGGRAFVHYDHINKKTATFVDRMKFAFGW